MFLSALALNSLLLHLFSLPTTLHLPRQGFLYILDTLLSLPFPVLNSYTFLFCICREGHFLSGHVSLSFLHILPGPHQPTCPFLPSFTVPLSPTPRENHRLSLPSGSLWFLFLNDSGWVFSACVSTTPLPRKPKPAQVQLACFLLSFGVWELFPDGAFVTVSPGSPLFHAPLC